MLRGGGDSQPQLAVPILIIAAYLFGFMVLMSRLVRGLFLSYRLRRSTAQVHDRRALRLVQWHAVAIGSSLIPMLAESPAVSVPLTLRVSHPVIVLPATGASGRVRSSQP